MTRLHDLVDPVSPCGIKNQVLALPSTVECSASVRCGNEITFVSSGVISLGRCG